VTASAKVERDFRHIVDSYERIACDEIVTVYDFYMDPAEGKSSAHALVIMEIYPASLKDYVIGHFEKTGRLLDPMVAQKVIEKVALMIGNLYTKKGFLFEDFKPENILIKEHLGDLKVVVGDIGGLKNVVSIGLTGSQVTPTYCAPEVIRKGQVPDMHSIMYSYGLLSFFILEGGLPYESKNFAARFDMIKESGVPFTRTDIPDTLRQVIEKCVAFEAENRFDTFDEVVQAIRGQIPVQQAPKDDAFAGGTITVGGGQAPASDDFAGGTITVGAGATTQAPSGGAGTGVAEPKTVPLKRDAPRRSRIAAKTTSTQSVSISDEKELIAKVEKKIKGRIIRRGESLKINNDSILILGNLIVETNAVLSLNNSKLFFGENAGIIVMGAIRAKGTLFSAIDPGRKWRNMMVYSTARAGVSIIDNCRFHFGGGISGKTLAEQFNISKPAIQATGTYGGGLFIAGGMEKTLTLKDITCYKCTATDGGGIYFHRTKANAEGCLLEGCSAKGSGGGLWVYDSSHTIRNLTCNKCTATRDGGGVLLAASSPSIEDSMFRSCVSKYFGGAIACMGANPAIKNCRFEICASTKSGGGIYADNRSKPQVSYPSFTKCRPDNTNFRT
jgi:hypothetical protein